MEDRRAGFDAKKLYLGKMSNDWQPLAEFDLAKLDRKVGPPKCDALLLAKVAATSSHAIRENVKQEQEANHDQSIFRNVSECDLVRRH